MENAKCCSNNSILRSNLIFIFATALLKSDWFHNSYCILLVWLVFADIQEN
jgi:hypothetical protein